MKYARPLPVKRMSQNAEGCRKSPMRHMRSATDETRRQNPRYLLSSTVAERSMTVGFSVFLTLVFSITAASDAYVGTFHAEVQGCTALDSAQNCGFVTEV